MSKDNGHKTSPFSKNETSQAAGGPKELVEESINTALGYAHDSDAGSKAASLEKKSQESKASSASASNSDESDSSASSSASSSNSSLSKKPSSSASSSQSASSATAPGTTTDEDKAEKRKIDNEPVTDADVARHDPTKPQDFINNGQIEINKSRETVDKFITQLSGLYTGDKEITKPVFNQLMKLLQHAFFTQYKAWSHLDYESRKYITDLYQKSKEQEDQIEKLSEIHAEGIEQELVSKLSLYVDKMHDVYEDPRFQQFLKNNNKDLKLTPSQPLIEKSRKLASENAKMKKQKEKDKNNNK